MTAAQHERFVSLLTRETVALVLAGGRGSRLEQLTRWRAKPAVFFAGKFRLIDFPLSNCVNSGIRRIGVLTQYKAHSLIRHIQHGWGFLRGHLGEFVEILPASQRIGTSWYAGTADAVYQNIDIIRDHDPDFLLILAGDHAYKMDYGPMIAHHVEQSADVTVACLEVPLDAARSLGVMSVDEAGEIIRFTEKPSDPEPVPGRDDVALGSLGIYVFRPEHLYRLLEQDAADPGSAHDFGKSIIPSMIGRDRVHSYRFVDPVTGKQAYWRDVGTIDSFWAANLELLDVDAALDLHDDSWPIWTHQQQLPGARFIHDEPGRRGMAIDSLVSAGCIVSGATVQRSLLFNNVVVHSHSSISEAVLLPDVDVGRNCRLRKVVIDRGCRIPDGTVVGEDPEEDRRRFYVSEGGVAVITPDMLGQARV